MIHFQKKNVFTNETKILLMVLHYPCAITAEQPPTHPPVHFYYNKIQSNVYKNVFKRISNLWEKINSFLAYFLLSKALAYTYAVKWK